jgi:hypothetical protein
MRTLLLLLAALLTPARQQTFKTAVDLVAVDVTVVDKTGTPIGDLKAEDFEVRISQRSRRVVTMERLTYGTSAPGPSPAPATAAVPASGPAQTEAPNARRRFVLAVDEHSLQAASALAAINAAVIRVPGTSPDVAFDRVLRETSAYYLLGVEVSEDDRDGRPHAIGVKVKRKGAEVRSRAEVIIPRR